MSDTKKGQIDRIERYANLIQKQTGKAVRPYRADGYVNLLNKYGTSRDASEQYTFVADSIVPDDVLSINYEGNGLFAKIIDTPAEEAVKHGFTLKNVTDKSVVEFYESALDELDWDEVAINCLKWARLFGGSIAVMLINDGRGLEEPLDWKNIRSIDDIRVYDRSVIQPDYDSMFSYDPQDPFRTRGSRLGMPEFYYVSSIYGSFTVHESRCLVFQNGVLPEKASNSIYRMWGVPEYVRINRALRDAEISHGSAVKMLDRSVQAVYKMKDLSMEMASEEGENRILKRLQVIDMARGLLNSIAIDNEGEDYDFRSFQFAGVSDVINVTCNFLSALTSIPQTILFGRSPAGMNATGESDFENYYNFVQRIQRRMLKSNLRYLLSVIFQAGVYTGEVEKVPGVNIEFNPLWSLTEVQQADLNLKNAQIQQTKMATASGYIADQVLDPREVRKSLVKSGEFEIDATFDDDDLDEENFQEMIEKITQNGGLAPAGGPASPTGAPDAMAGGQASPDAAPAATKLPQDMTDGEVMKASMAHAQQGQQPPTSPENEETNADDILSSQNGKGGSVGVLVLKDGKILTGIRKNEDGCGLICGPGGHIEADETPVMAAVREAYEEFNIYVKELIPIGMGKTEPETGLSPYLYICTDFDGEPSTDEDEMTEATFLSLEEIKQLEGSLFAPFADSIEYLLYFLMELDGDNRFDADTEKIDWITVNGTHVPIDDEGNALGGGKLAGKNFSNAKSQKKEKSSRNSESSIDASKLSTTSPDKGAIVVGKLGNGSTVSITKKSGKQITFTKIGDDKWSRSDDPDHTYGNWGVAANCWKSEVSISEKESKNNNTESEQKKESSKTVEKEHEPAKSSQPSGRYVDLAEKVDNIKTSEMSKEQKASAYKDVLEKAEVGTTFKLRGVEYRKNGRTDYPYDIIGEQGERLNSVDQLSIDFDIDYYADKENCLEFFDKEAIVSKRKNMVSNMESSGNFKTSESVHRDIPGKITASSPDFGKPGDYVVYRNGSIGSSGMVFFAPKKEGADSYAFAHENGNTGQYEVHVNNPLVIRGETDTECIRKAYDTLHPAKPLKGNLNSSKWISCDKQNASALNSGVGGYDSILYVINGKPAELQIPGKAAKKSVKKTGEYTTTKWSRAGRTYQEAVMGGMIDESAEDYKRVDSKSDGFGDDEVHCSEGRYNEILKNMNNDGGPGSGNFGHKGVPGQVGGSAPSESGYKSMIGKAAESKNYKGAMEKFGDLLRQENELQKKLKSIPTTAPKDKWTDDDRLLVEICGRQYAPTNPEWTETYNQIESIRKERRRQLNKANRILLEQEPAPHLEDFDRPKDASGEYEGFKVGDTGTSTDISKARIVEMSPKEYLERCAAMFNDTQGAETNLTMQVRGLNSENVKKYAEQMKNGEKFNTPWLDERGINGQEGRHRAAAAFEAGIEKIPVVFWERKVRSDERTDSLNSGMDRNSSDSDENSLDNLENQVTITVQDNLDGAPYGNENACGPHKRQHLSKADKERYSKRLVGQTTSDGVTVKKIADHAYDRIAQRNLSPKRIEDMLKSAKVVPDKNHPNRRCYDIPGSRLVLDHTDGTIVTIEWRSQNK